MGYRLHYTKKYDVEYGGGFFNHNSGAINELLQDLNVFECPPCNTKEEFINLIKQ